MLRTTQDRTGDALRVHISYDNPSGGCSRWHTDGLTPYEAETLCGLIARVDKELTTAHNSKEVI